VLTNFSKSIQYQIRKNPFSGSAVVIFAADRQTGMPKLTAALLQLSVANALRKNLAFLQDGREISFLDTVEKVMENNLTPLRS
jgi:hypothetical protein